ncbi:MAG: DUF805 domain-containing protein [Rubrivivax sp.]|nr:DUF805 domain-containing protein [Rubrivivax sp.]MBK7261296.1 DUF805 domain-containing protein [Rubrivivax sp.]MBK8529642.1 DUF805 domain-containing protein [Rubrivivax sp.]
MQLQIPASEPLLVDDQALWRLWLDPRGRIDRATFWRHGVFALSGLALLLRLLLDIARVPAEWVDQGLSLLLAWPLLAISAKRWHDRDRPAWWVLVLLIPVAGVLWLLLDNGFVRGTPGRNRYGDAPADG